MHDSPAGLHPGTGRAIQLKEKLLRAFWGGVKKRLFLSICRVKIFRFQKLCGGGRLGPCFLQGNVAVANDGDMVPFFRRAQRLLVNKAPYGKAWEHHKEDVVTVLVVHRTHQTQTGNHGFFPFRRALE